MEVLVIVRTEGDYNAVGSVFSSLPAMYKFLEEMGMDKDFEMEASELLVSGFVEYVETTVRDV